MIKEKNLKNSQEKKDKLHTMKKLMVTVDFCSKTVQGLTREIFQTRIL